MIWIKLGILIIGFIYAGFIPLTLRKVLRKLAFNLHEETLSFLSDKSQYDRRIARGYTKLLLLTALLHYAFFWLLSQQYNLGEHETYMLYTSFSFALMALLAFVPHNMEPYSFRNLSSTLKRAIHNLLAFVVFFTLPLLIVLFLTAIIHTYPIMAITGLIIIGITAFLTAYSIFRRGLTGICEIIFIVGVSIWTIFITICTVLFI
ncbi:MAG: DUF998 domain-containing protein [Bacteroidales bacterium]|nr:DUF998 domain-containing protein [Bacteroidales bacterium]